MADELLTYTKAKCFAEFENDDGLLRLYNEMVKDLHNKLNPLKYATITVNCSVQFADLDKAIEFLEEGRERMKNNVDARLYLRVA